MAGMIPADAVAIGIGAFFGALSRYQAGRIAAEWIATDPNRLGKFAGWHTAGINMGGSFLLGGITASPVVNRPPKPPAPTSMSMQKLVPNSSSNSKRAFAELQGLSPRTKLMLGVGFCGSYTTFSTYSVDVVTWLSEGKTTRALSYVATNNVGGFVAAAAGMVLVKKFFG
jgi:fluoride ion exporter CrcB/FEX